MSYEGDLDKVRKKAEQQGWRYDKTTGGHHRFFSPDKESIVTASGTPGDQRGWLNFLAEMKRAGYKDDFGALGHTLGEALQAAQEKNNAPPAPPVEQPTVSVKEDTVSVTDHVRSLLKNHPTKVFSVEEIMTKVKAVSKKANKPSVSQALTTGAKRGTFKRVGEGRSGLYQWGGAAVPTKAEQAKKIKEATHKGAVVGAMTGDPTIDADLTIIDEALGALGRIEEVVKRNRDRLFAMAELKKKMGW